MRTCLLLLTATFFTLVACNKSQKAYSEEVEFTIEYLQKRIDFTYSDIINSKLYPDYVMDSVQTLRNEFDVLRDVIIKYKDGKAGKSEISDQFSMVEDKFDLFIKYSSDVIEKTNILKSAIQGNMKVTEEQIINNPNVSLLRLKLIEEGLLEFLKESAHVDLFRFEKIQAKVISEKDKEGMVYCTVWNENIPEKVVLTRVVSLSGEVNKLQDTLKFNPYKGGFDFEVSPPFSGQNIFHGFLEYYSSMTGKRRVPFNFKVKN